jgi:hypothetical protein
LGSSQLDEELRDPLSVHQYLETFIFRYPFDQIPTGSR